MIVRRPICDVGGISAKVNADALTYPSAPWYRRVQISKIDHGTGSAVVGALTGDLARGKANEGIGAEGGRIISCDGIVLEATVFEIDGWTDKSGPIEYDCIGAIAGRGGSDCTSVLLAKVTVGSGDWPVQKSSHVDIQSTRMRGVCRLQRRGTR